MSEPVIRPGCESFTLDGGPVGILMIHGFTGSPASLRPMGDWLGSQGLSVKGVRLPGHGTDIADLRARRWIQWHEESSAALSALRERCRTVVILGQSLGGALALHLAASRPRDVDGLALCSPYVFDARLLLLPLAGRFLRTVKGIGNDIRLPGQDERAYDAMPVKAIVTMAELLKIVRSELRSVRAPTLVFEPGADHVIPSSNARKVHRRIGSERKELIRCPNSYHVITMDHDAAMVRARVLAFALELDGAKG